MARTEESPWLWPLDSERLRLLPARVEHADAFADASMESEAEVSQWSRRVSGQRDRASYVEKAIARARSTILGTDVQRYAFTRDSPEQFVASVAMQPWQDPRSTDPRPPLRVDAAPDLELGYWCRTSMVGKGFASEAVAAVVTHAFDDLGAEALWLRMGEKNERSRRLAERLGFVEFERVAFPASPEWGEAATVLIMRRGR